jgi:hypothetical protein
VAALSAATTPAQGAPADQVASAIPASRSSPSSQPVPTHPSTASPHSAQAAAAAHDRDPDRPLTLVPTASTRTPPRVRATSSTASLPSLRPGSVTNLQLPVLAAV